MLSRIPHYLQLNSLSAQPGRKTGASDELFSAALNREQRQISVTDEGGRRLFGAPHDVTRPIVTWPTPFDPKPTAALDVSSATQEARAGKTPFVPKFQENVRVVSAFGGSWRLNPAYFATRATAEWIARKYGTGEVVEVPYEGQGGPFWATAQEFHIKLPGGRMINAGLLADYYRRMPEGQFPGLADQCIREAIAAANHSV